MALDLLAGIPVTGCAAALPWYERFSGERPSFLPSDTEAVGEVAGHRYVYIVQDQGGRGTPWCCRSPVDPGNRVAAVSRRGIQPARRETCDSGTAKVTCQDADGNEISLGRPG
jgi:hypothetical protein